MKIKTKVVAGCRRGGWDGNHNGRKALVVKTRIRSGRCGGGWDANHNGRQAEGRFPN